MILCKEIRKVPGGFVVVVRYPYGGDPLSGFGEVVCATWEAVVDLLQQAGATERHLINPPTCWACGRVCERQGIACARCTSTGVPLAPYGTMAEPRVKR